jgi:outer membrane protein TolC
MKWCSLLVIALLIVQPGFAQETQDTTAAAAGTRVMTLQEAIDLALKNNLDIQVEQLNPEIDDTFITTEESRFEPLFTSQLFNQDQDIPTGSRLAGEGTLTSTNFAYDFRLDQVLKTGTTYSVSFNNSRSSTNQLFTSVDPRFDSTLFLDVSQPLMRNFGLDITTTPLKIAETNSKAADQRLQTRILDIQLQVTQAYLDLAFAIYELDVFKQSLAYARDLYENNKKQVEVGTLAPLEVVVAEAEVATREQQIIAGETAISNTQDRLKTLILGEKAETSDDVITVTGSPRLVPLSITEEEAIKKALADNPDLKALELDLQSQALNKKFAQNQMKPQVDLVGGYGYTGLGGDRIVFSDDIFNPVPIGVEPGGYGDALSNLWENPTWNLGLRIGLPLGNREAQAAYVRADLNEKQTKLILENSRQNLILNVRTALRNIQSSLKQVEASRVSVRLEEKKLDAERKKLNVGLSTNNVVLDFQEDLARAQSVELLAIVSYLKNLAQLERFLGERIGERKMQ